MEGPNCDIPCRKGVWGVQCRNRCHCLNNEVCGGEDGACENGCAEWYTGRGCHHELPRLGVYMPNVQLIKDDVVRIELANTTNNSNIIYNMEYRSVDTNDTNWLHGHLNKDGTEVELDFNTSYEIRIVPFDQVQSMRGEPSQIAHIRTGCQSDQPLWGSVCTPCRCADERELCEKDTGFCESGCIAAYIGEGCAIEIPSFKGKFINITSENSLIRIELPKDMSYSLINGYIVEYQIPNLSEQWHMVKIDNNRQKRSIGTDNILTFTPYYNYINCLYNIYVTPVIDEVYDVPGVSSDMIPHEAGCGDMSTKPGFVDSCEHWCLCSNDPSSVCLLTCDSCYACDTEPELPSGKDVSVMFLDVSSSSLTLSLSTSNENILSYKIIYAPRLNNSNSTYVTLNMNKSIFRRAIKDLVDNMTYMFFIFPMVRMDALNISFEGFPLQLETTTLKSSSRLGTIYLVVILAAISLVLFIIVLIVCLFVKQNYIMQYLRKMNSKSILHERFRYTYAVDANNNAFSCTMSDEAVQGTFITNIDDSINLYATPTSQRKWIAGIPIETNHLAEYIHNMQSSNHSLEKEFGKIRNNSTATTIVADMQCNARKNQFKDIKAYDHSRIVLSGNATDASWSYINASYIDGFHQRREFIASQAPNKHTANDMWRMIWETNVSTIVMLTRESEGQYWPDEDRRRYGDFEVEHLSTSYFSFYIERHLVITSGEHVRTIIHLQYTSWPDHNTPETAEFLEFHTKVEMMKKTGPLLVHCSAGVGRTGTFIAIDYVKKQAKSEFMVDVFSCVTSLRNDRVDMVQTPEQYR